MPCPCLYPEIRHHEWSIIYLNVIQGAEGMCCVYMPRCYPDLNKLFVGDMISHMCSSLNSIFQYTLPPHKNIPLHLQTVQGARHVQSTDLSCSSGCGLLHGDSNSLTCFGKVPIHTRCGIYMASCMCATGSSVLHQILKAPTGIYEVP